MRFLGWHQPRDSEPLLTTVGRWTGAALCVAVVQGGAAWAVLNWPKPVEAAGEPAGAIMIEIAPVPIAPDVPPPQDVAVGPEQAHSDASDDSKGEEKPEDEPEPEPEPEPKPPEPEPIETPKLEEQPKAEAVLPPKPEEEQPKEIEPEEIKQPVEEKPKKKRKPPKRQMSVASQAAAPRPVDKAQKGKVNKAPRAGTASSMSAATWRGRLVAHLNRHKRHPGGKARGTSSISFTIDRSGQVIGARLTKSSGNPSLDNAALSLARRASPMPAPPDAVGGGTITISVPVRFTR